ncbi:MAG: LacI family DNA-binding transcriptional regulator [Spirochaetaceae bacterium]|nr:MAG: LacI family DNA-binding transcriptional regulator [Spirochaetaceae bacterium]
MATIKDVARMAGVSIGTVDRVLNNRGRVARETFRRVQQAIEELNYSPNLTARHLSMAKAINFGVMMPRVDQDSGYWAMPQSGIARAARDLAFHKVSAQHFYFDRHCPDSFERCCRKVRSAELDGLLIAPVLSRPAQRFLDTMTDENHTAVVLFDSRVEADGRYTFVGQDPFDSGVVAGKMLRILMRTTGTVVVITVGTDDYHLERRAEGIQHFFVDTPAVRIEQISLVEGPGIDPNAELTRRLPRDLAGVEGIFVTNALSHIMVEYIQKQGEARHIPLIAYDLIPQNIAYLREGKIDFVISQEPETQGYEALYELYRQVVLGSAPAETIGMPIELVTRENLDSYLNARPDSL